MRKPCAVPTARHPPSWLKLRVRRESFESSVVDGAVLSSGASSSISAIENSSCVVLGCYGVLKGLVLISFGGGS